jgi:hypothetical protein
VEKIGVLLYKYVYHIQIYSCVSLDYDVVLLLKCRKTKYVQNGKCPWIATIDYFGIDILIITVKSLTER